LILNSRYEKVWSSAFLGPERGVLEKSLYSDNIMIIGNAAEFIAPIMGESMRSSIVSGQVAAETATKALNEENFSSQILKDYKHHPNIKKIIRNFKMMGSFGNFFYEKNGLYVNNAFKIAEQDPFFNKKISDNFLFNKMPSRDLMTRIREFKG